MAFAAVARGVWTGNTSASTVTGSPSANFAASSWAVLAIASDNSSGGGGSNNINSVTDDIGNTWTIRTAPIFDNGAANAGVQGAIATCAQDVGPLLSTTVITVTNNNNNVAKAVLLWEITTDGALSFITGGVNTGAATNAPTLTTAAIDSGDMVIAALHNEYGTAQTVTQDGDTTNGSWNTQQTVGIGATAAGMTVASQCKVVTATATQTYNPTLGTSSDVILSYIVLRQAIGFTASVTSSIDAVVAQRNTATAGLSAHVGPTPITASINAVVQTSRTATASLNATVQQTGRTVTASLDAYVHRDRYPTSASAMATAVGQGTTWGVGFLFDESNVTPPAPQAAFGSPSFVGRNGSPQQGLDGPYIADGIDKAIGLPTNAEVLTGDGSLYITEANDWVAAFVFKVSDVTTNAVLWNKNGSGGTNRLVVFKNLIGNFTCSFADSAGTTRTFSAGSPLAADTWYAAIVVVTRNGADTKKFRAGWINLSTGSVSVGTELNNAWLGQTDPGVNWEFQGTMYDGGGPTFAAAYLGTGSGYAGTLSTNLSTGLSNFRNYLLAAQTVDVTASIDAVVRTSPTVTASINAVVQGARTATASISGVVQTARSITSSLSGVVQQAGRTITSSVSGVVQLRRTVTATINAVVQSSPTVTSTIGAVVQSSSTVTASLDAAVQQTGTVTSAIDAAVQTTGTITTGFSAYVDEIVAANSIAANLDAAVQQTGTITSSVDAAIQQTGTITASIGAAVQDTRSVTASISATVQSTDAVTSTINAVVQSSPTVTAGLDASVVDLSTPTASADLDAVVQTTLTVTASLSAVTQDTRAITTSLSAVVQDTGTVTASLDAHVQAVRTSTANFDAHVIELASSTVTASLNAVVQDTRTATTSLAAVVQDTSTVTTSLDTAVRDTGTVTASVGAVVQDTRVVTASVNAVVQGPVTATASLSAAVQTQFTITSTLDAYLSLSATFSISAGMDAYVRGVMPVVETRTAIIGSASSTVTASGTSNTATITGYSGKIKEQP